MTADVPKIARVCGEGIVTLARLSGRPIVPVAVVTSRRIDFESWDRASLGLPFGRGAMVLGEPIRVAARRRRGRARGGAARRRGRARPGARARLRARRRARSRRGHGAATRGRRLRRRPHDRRPARAPARLPRRPVRPGAGRRRPPRLAPAAGQGGRRAPRRAARHRRHGRGRTARSPGCTAPASARRWPLLPVVERLTQARPRGARHLRHPRPRPSWSPAACRRAPCTSSCPSTCRATCAASSTIGGRTSRSSPNRRSGRTSILDLERRGIPLVLVNGRMSERSFRRWRRMPDDRAGAARTLRALPRPDARPTPSGCARSARRTVAVAGNLKFDARPPPADPRAVAQLSGRGRRPAGLDRGLARIRARRSWSSPPTGRSRAASPASSRSSRPATPGAAPTSPRSPPRTGLRAGAALAKARQPDRGDGRLRRRHHRRARPVLPPVAARPHGRLARAARRPEPDRAGEARRGDPARAARPQLRATSTPRSTGPAARCPSPTASA